MGSMKDRVVKALDTLESRNIISDAGKDWLIASLDPFHDFNYKLDGYPDMNSVGSIVQVVNKQISITGNGTDPFDVHVYFFPDGKRSTYGQGVLNNGTISIANTDQSFGVETVGYIRSPVGARTFPIGNNPANLNITGGGFGLESFTNEGFRLIGGGFEVTNVTAELYRGGTVTAYRNTAKISEEITNFQDITNAATYCQQTLSFDMPPGNLEQTTQIPASRVWNAEEGCYTVFTQTTPNNPFAQARYRMACVKNSVGGDVANEVCFYQRPTTLSAPVSGNSYITKTTTSHAPLPFNQCGAYFTGLTPQTQLTLNVKFILERCPSHDNNDLITLATASAPYDPIALSIYSGVTASMPPGCPVHMNALGDWWRNINHLVADTAPKLGLALGNVFPPAKMVGDTVGQVASILGNMNLSQKPIVEFPKDKKKKKDKKAKKAKKLRKLVEAAMQQQRSGTNVSGTVNSRALVVRK